MVPYKSPFATAVPNTLEKRMEIANAIRALASQESEQLRQRRADIAALRRDLELLRRSFPGLIAQAIAEVRRDCDPRRRSYVLKYSPDQPRVPAGNPDGGQWTGVENSDVSGEFGEPPGDADADQVSDKPATTPARGSPVISDATPDDTWIPGAQYAGGPEEEDGENRFRGEPVEATPGQAARLAAAQGLWHDAVSRVEELDPSWKPTPGIYETTEGQIADIEAQTREAEERLRELAGFGIGPGPFAGESIPARGPTRNFTAGERREINRIGRATGCHTCGTRDPETDRDNFIPDHQPPSALNSSGRTQRLYPQCLTCSRRQGGWITGNRGAE